jgi:hypothetical protein
MNRSAKFAFSCVCIIVAVTVPTYAWLRYHVEDADLVDRSKLIVVARLRPESIKYVPHQRKKNEGRSWEHHATLIVTEVLKGELCKKEIPIVIHYGLDPYIGGRCPKDDGKINIHPHRKDFPKDVVEILDTGNSGFGLVPLVEDAGKNNIWFLQKRSGRYGRKSENGRFGIADPEELQPLSLKSYFLACLAEDPEKAAKKELKKNPALALRVERYLLYMEFQRVLSITDPNGKAIRLSCYLFPGTAPKGYNGRYDSIIRRHLRELKEHAVPPILDILTKAEPRHKLNTLVLILYDIGEPAKPAVPYLRKMLEQKCRTSTYYILSALQTTGDPNAIASVRPFLTHKDLQVRAQAAETLAWLGDTDSFDRIVAVIPEEISDQKAHYVKDMCGALYRLDPARARPIIKKVNARTPSMDITRFISRYKDNDD